MATKRSSKVVFEGKTVYFDDAKEADLIRYILENGGGKFKEDIQYQLENGQSFGRLEGSGTYAVPDGGISVDDFIRDVLSSAEAAFQVTSVGAWDYNETTVIAATTGTFNGESATLKRSVNGGAVEELSTGLESGFVFNDTTLPTFPTGQQNVVTYTLDVLNSNGLIIDTETANLTQTAYAAPGASVTVTRAGSNSRSADETGLIREIGNDESNVAYTFSRSAPLVEMTESRIERNGVVINTQPITGNPPSFSFTLSNDAPASPTTNFTYQAEVDDSENTPASSTGIQTVQMRFPTMFVANTADGSGGATDLQAVYDTVISAATGTFALRAGAFSENFTSSSDMVQSSGSNKYGWVLYDSSLGALTVVQNGTEVDWSANTFTGTITNDFGETLSVTGVRSPFLYPSQVAGETFTLSAG